MEHQQENRGRQVLVGGAVSGGLLVLVVSLLLGWRYLPGWVGEGFGVVAGVITTPFFMEATFFVTGMLIVVGLNIWRRNREGDEFVYIDESGLDGEPTRLEAALRAGNDDEVKAMLGRMDDRQFGSLRVLRVRIALAEKMGDQELVAGLRRALQETEHVNITR